MLKSLMIKVHHYKTHQSQHVLIISNSAAHLKPSLNVINAVLGKCWQSLRKVQLSAITHSPYPYFSVALTYWDHCCHLLDYCCSKQCLLLRVETSYVICHEKSKSFVEKYHIYFHRKCIFYTILHMHSHTIVHISVNTDQQVLFFSLIHRASTKLQTWEHLFLKTAWRTLTLLNIKS